MIVATRMVCAGLGDQNQTLAGNGLVSTPKILPIRRMNCDNSPRADLNRVASFGPATVIYCNIFNAGDTFRFAQTPRTQKMSRGHTEINRPRRLMD